MSRPSIWSHLRDVFLRMKFGLLIIISFTKHHISVKSFEHLLFKYCSLSNFSWKVFQKAWNSQSRKLCMQSSIACEFFKLSLQNIFSDSHHELQTAAVHVKWKSVSIVDITADKWWCRPTITDNARQSMHVEYSKGMTE